MFYASLESQLFVIGIPLAFWRLHCTTCPPVGYS